MTLAAQQNLQVVAVIVAYNRAELLQECLDGIAAQTRPVEAVIVVDNRSEDDSVAVAEQHSVVTKVVRLSQNSGGAGGFTAGIAHALGSKSLSDSDFLWIMDDDTIPHPDTLEKLLRAASDYQGRPAVLASRALWTDGRTHPMNAHRWRPLLNCGSSARAKRIGARSVRAASFVSVLLEVRQIRISGLPVADYFLWNDDLEYTARLLKSRVGLYVPDSTVTHKTKKLASASDDPGERFYYEVRNKLWFLFRSQALRGIDRLLYGTSTAVRWTKLFFRAQSRRRLLRQLIRGISDGILSAPRTNEEVFGADPETQQMVVACEKAGQVWSVKK